MDPTLPPVAIPSYQRSHVLVAKTLRFLHLSRYPARLITIFVANREEEAYYKTVVPRDLYGEMVVAAPGLSSARNCISAFYPEGSWLLQMDDDVTGLKFIHGHNCSLSGWIANAIARAAMVGAELCGVMPNSNGMNMSDKWTTHLTHIIGSFFLHKVRRDLVCSRCEKEDYERSIQYFLRDGKVLRFKGAGVITRYNQGGGGLQDGNRTWRMREGAVALAAQYPAHCKMIMKKGMADISLNWRAKVEDGQVGEGSAQQQ
jgi:hypothetical protein